MVSRTLRSLKPSPAMVVAVVALVGGGAVGTAATLITGAQIKDGSIAGRDVKNGSIAGLDVKNGSIAGVDVKDSSITGQDVKDGSLPLTKLQPIPFTTQLPSGQTLRGVYSVGGMQAAGAAQNLQYSAVTFAYGLPSDPVPHFIGRAAAPPPECPGNVTTPAAAPGHLCVYEGGQFSNSGPAFVNPRAQSGVAVSPWGFVLSDTPAFPGSSASFNSHGTWAVTAP